MDPAPAAQVGDSGEERRGVAHQELVATWSPWGWNGVSEAPAGRSSSGWAHFGPATNSVNASDWAAEFVEDCSSVSGGGERDEKPWEHQPSDTLETTKSDNRFISTRHNGRLALDDWSTGQNWDQCICDGNPKDHVHVTGHASACTCTCGTDSAVQTPSPEAIRHNWKPREMNDDLEWQAFTSCGTDQQTSSTETENQSNIFGSFVAPGPMGHVAPLPTVRELASKPQSSSAPVELRPRANAIVDPDVCEQSCSVFRHSFAVPHHLGLTVSGSEVISPLSMALDQRQGLWSNLVGSSSPDYVTSTFTSIHHRLYGVLFPEQACGLADSATPRELSVDLSSGFDWTEEPDRAGSVSPDFLPSIFRPKRESLVDVEFDHMRAAAGLASLSMEELHTMCDEMTTKFQRLSDELISELQQRDVVVSEMDSKNRFISCILKVQNLRHCVRSGVNGSGLDVVVRNRHRPWSTKSREEKQPGKYLHTIIPYNPPEDMQWRVSTLRQLIKILQAIAEDSDSVPSLVSDYLQSEVLVSPVKEKPPVSLVASNGGLHV